MKEQAVNEVDVFLLQSCHIDKALFTTVHVFQQ